MHTIHHQKRERERGGEREREFKQKPRKNIKISMKKLHKNNYNDIIIHNK